MRLFSYILFLSLVSIRALADGPYDALPLKSPVAKEPHFQTSQGRENHRFADAKINAYRLYDFYSRQAEYHLEKKSNTTLLLPYPGLEGGRRGHWGVTNEKLSSAVLKRTQEPAYHRLLNRGAAGNQYVCFQHASSQSFCLFANSSPSMKKVVLQASLKTPIHAFGYQVDRFGFDIAATGKDYLVNSTTEWHTPNRKPLTVTNDGYHLHGNQVIFRRSIGADEQKTNLLDIPSITFKDGTAIYSRRIEWKTNRPALCFALPESAIKFTNPTTTIEKKGSAWLATTSDKTQQLTHQITTTGSLKGVQIEEHKGKLWLSLPAGNSGDTNETLTMSSWITTPDKPLNTPINLQFKKPSTLTSGGKRFFQNDIAVTGTLDADPAAKNTAYTIDEIPVPIDNPYSIPMTTCGITFDSKGAAYIPTLVGDIWKVTGLDHSLESVRWQRYATGLNSPLGIVMHNGIPHVLTQHGILRVQDLNHDGEADLITPFTKFKFPTGRLHNLRKDASNHLYCCHVSGIYKVSPDGSSMQKISTSARNPLGLGVRHDGLALSDSSEGNHSNGTCTIYESQHAENKNTSAKNRRILYLPRGVDNSPGSRIFLDHLQFGPLGKSIIGLSYGTGSFYQILRGPNSGTPQAALIPMAGEFPSGTARLAMHPSQPSLYVVGFDGWGDFATKEGSLSRIRFTGKQSLQPVAWKTYDNAISIKFNTPINPNSITKDSLFLQQWNYVDSQNTYGSAEYSVRKPNSIGHDRLKVESIHLSEDRTELFIIAPDILPAMCTHIYGKLKSSDGHGFTLNFYATINALPKAAAKGKPATKDKSSKLIVPSKNNNGNTYQTLAAFFDKREGRTTANRPTGPIVKYVKKDLNYQWIHTNIIQKQNCISCHGKNSKYDFSSYQSLSKFIDLKQPHKSHLLGMMKTGSMPPYPMPTVPKEMQNALQQWIEKGAPEM